jgi:hypothetical protein
MVALLCRFRAAHGETRLSGKQEFHFRLPADNKPDNSAYEAGYGYREVVERKADMLPSAKKGAANDCRVASATSIEPVRV